MFTRCPSCRTLYRLHQGLADSLGVVACSTCDDVFDCFDSLQAAAGDASVAVVGRPPDHGELVLARRGIPLAKPYLRMAPQPLPATAVKRPPRLSNDDAAVDNARGAIARFLTGFFGLASRNLVRNRRRSGFAFAAIAFGVIAILLAGGFIEWILWALRESAIEAQLGHVQIVQEGYFKDGQADPYEYLLPEKSANLEAVEELSSVKAVAPRIYFTGLLSKGDSTVSFLGQGIDPSRELIMSGTSVAIIEGKNLDSDEPEGIILGVGLADNVDAKVGDSVVLLATTAAGGTNAVETTISGVFSTSVKAFDDSALRVPIAIARQLVKASGSHVWVVMLHDTALTGTALVTIKSLFANSTDELEFIPWHQLELADFYNKAKRLLSQQVTLVWVVIGLLILLTISNSLMMSVMERTSEIGTLMAIGLRRSVVLKLFLAEGLLLGMAGGGCGVAAGLALSQLISEVGIPMPPSPGTTESFMAEIMVTPGLAIGGMALAIGATTIAAVYPAFKASRLEIVNALRHNR